MEQAPESAGIHDYIALLRRRRGVMFATFSGIAIAVVLGTFFLDDQFRSTATIAIERPEVPENLARTTFTYFDTDLRIDRIRNRVLARPNVEAWIREFDLYEQTVAEESIQDAVSEFRDDVEVITIQAREDIAVRKQGETIAFTVSYYGETPAKAVAVASELAKQFLTENRASRNESVQNTVDFFARDVEQAAARVDEAEQRLAEFKERHSGALPNTAIANTQLLDRYERELDDVEQDLRDIRERKRILETDLAKESPTAPVFNETGETILTGAERLRFLQQQLVELSAKYGPEHPDVVRTRREIELLRGGDATVDSDAIRNELEEARREYQTARQRYTVDHPDVTALANRIGSLEAQLANMGNPSRDTEAPQPDNPAYLSILVQIEAADDDLYALRSRAAELRGRIDEYRQLIAQSPQVEREYLALERQYQQALADYNEARAKRTEAQQALDLEISEKAERYVLQYSPSEPLAPAFPNRLAIIILGLIFAFATSIGSALVAEALDTRVRGVRDLRNLTGMPPIAVIPVLETAHERRNRVYAWSVSLLGVSTLLVVMITMQI